jgi:hypothetical protein
MALNSNAFVEGIDPTGTFGGYASVLLQLIRQALPSSTYGMVLYDSATPDVAGANVWRQRCVWLDMTDTANPVAKIYRTTGSPGWVSINSLISNNTITTAMIQNAAVTLAKLSVAGGAANQLIRVNAGATAFEFVNFSSLFGVGTVPINSLVTSAVPPASFRALGSFGGAASTWFTADDIAGEFSAGSVSALAIVPAATLSAASRFLTSRTADTGAVWRLFDPVNDISDGGISGVKITTNTLAVTKLVPGSEGQVLTVTGGVPVWSSSSPITPTTFEENFVFATGTFDNAGIDANTDVALTLPASREWKDLEIFIYWDKSGAGGATLTLKWNTAPETGAVGVGSSTGCGRNTVGLSGTNTGNMLRWNGVVPATIDGTNITFRIEISGSAGIFALTNTRYEIRARATANV